MIDGQPGLVALYDIQPWNGTGLFLQPRSPHGAVSIRATKILATAVCMLDPVKIFFSFHQHAKFSYCLSQTVGPKIGCDVADHLKHVSPTRVIH